MNAPPRVTLGVPVYNGEKYLAAALDSALAQTFPDIQIIISDNLSTDRTLEIAEKYAEAYDQISVIQQEENLGAARNWNALFHASTSEYFGWLACDDIMAPEYVSKCVEALDAQPDLAGSYSRSMGINAAGEQTGQDFRKELGRMRFDDERIWIRHHDQVVGLPPNTLFGIFRRSVLEKTQLHRVHTGSDRTFLAEMMLYGPMVGVEPKLFYRRIHDEAFSEMKISGAAARTYFGGSAGPKRQSALLERIKNHLGDIKRAELDTKTTVICSATVLVRLPMLYAKHQIPPRVKRRLGLK